MKIETKIETDIRTDSCWWCEKSHDTQWNLPRISTFILKIYTFLIKLVKDIGPCF